MHNEVSTSPIQTISFSPKVSHDITGTKHQKDPLKSLKKCDQDTPNYKGKEDI